MGVELTLVLDRTYCLKEGSPIRAYDRLQLDPWGAGFFARLPVQPLPSGCPLDWYGDDGTVLVTKDAHDTPLTYTTAAAVVEALRDKKNATEVVLDPTPWNKAVYALLLELAREQPDMAIVLWWH